MLKIRRLNMDSSWQLSWGNTTVLIDPWLLGSEVDGFSWFNEQWHTTPSMAVSRLGRYDAVLISQPFSDHCHQQTLKELKEVPILGTPKAHKRLNKELPGRDIKSLPNLLSREWMNFGDLAISYLASTKKLSAAFDGLIIRKEQDIVVYCPHGFNLTSAHLSILGEYKTKLLLTGFSLFQLPFFLGGTVNPGKNAALELIEGLNPTKVVHTHDENKKAKGLVKKIAKVNYSSPESLQEELGNKFEYLDESYEWYTV
ncbi:MAG: MBL fold metallo-hydrolase [Aureispira sp.]|nr:MBL fold metallo-hydrolase [Aureispira sp.]